MEFKKNKFSILLIFLLFTFLNITKEDDVTNIIYVYMIIQPPNLKYKGFLRKLWNEEIHFNKSKLTEEEKESIEHCDSSDYKYTSYFAYGQKYDFEQNSTLNIYNAVSIKIYHIYKYSNR